MLTSLLPVSKSLWSYNPLPRNCVLYIPAFHNSIRGPVFKSVDSFGHTCTVTGASKTNEGFSYDGDDKITVAQPSTIPSGGAARSMMAWVNPDSFTAARYFIGWGVFAENNYFALFHVQTSGELAFASHTNNANSGFNLTAGVWQLVGITYALDATEVKFYVNGDLKSTVSLSSAVALDTTASDVYIGALTGSSAFFIGDEGEGWIHGVEHSAEDMAYAFRQTRGIYNV
ncbi:hypothetical protein LCGC14_2359260 [marine sediment metagenome]|uniref:LamG-like jellyroll fold domain-containing protein n=1 Tax=marine sediment metagenome TaxID=412755 RepID=A0A0F9C7B1_9ZZZZ